MQRTNLLHWLAFLAIYVLHLTSTAYSQVEEPHFVPSSRPNILWLVAEDLSPYLPAFGDPTIETPHLSRLAADGVIHTNVYSPSGVCAPSRAAIAIGLYPTSFGANHMRTNGYTEVTGLPSYEAVPPPEARMMSEVLRKAGYYCTNNSKQDYQFTAPVTAWDESSNFAHWRNRAEGQPFFSIFNFTVTHESGLFEPYGLRKSEMRHYKAGDRSFSAADLPDGEMPVHVSKDTKLPLPPYLPDTETVRRDLWKMYNNIAEMDQQVGAILAQLEEDGLLESTIIMFYGDHGGPLPRQKRMLYDSGLNVPLIIRYPDKWRAGTQDERLISFVDFAPTTFSWAGIAPPDHLQGQAFSGQHAASEERKYIHAASDRFDGFTDCKRAVRDKRFKYIRNYRPEQGYYLPVTYREQIPTMQELLRMRDEGTLNAIQSQWFRERKPPEELFDCATDPHEFTNLATDPEYADKLNELRAECDRWLEEIGDKANLPERELISELWQGVDEQLSTARPELAQSDVILTLSSRTEGASIGYKIIENGTEPKSWNVYTEPIRVGLGSKIKAVAHRIGYKKSEVVEMDVSP